MLPTVEQVCLPRKSFPRWRVDAHVQQHSPALRGDDARVQGAAAVENTRPTYFLSPRARKAVMAGSIRDGP